MFDFFDPFMERSTIYKNFSVRIPSLKPLHKKLKYFHMNDKIGKEKWIHMHALKSQNCL